jgi:hypothetical protein
MGRGSVGFASGPRVPREGLGGRAAQVRPEAGPRWPTRQYRGDETKRGGKRFEKAMSKPTEIDGTHQGEAFVSRPVPRGATDVVALAHSAFAREPGLFAVGVAGLVISFLCLVAVAARGTFIPPEGKMLDAATFTFGVAVFTLTMALLLPLAGYSERGRRRWRRAYYVFAGYALVLESLQAFRGLDPRFSEAGGQLDEVAGGIFGLTAGLNTVLFLILGLRFFRSDVLRNRPTLRLGIRYGAAAVMLSFGVGIIMSVISGREVGAAGNLLLSHGLGVHAIQALPLAALLLERVASTPRPTSWLHAAGIGWLIASTAAFVQALLGRPPLEKSVLTTLIVVGLMAWAAATGYSLLSWRQAAPG